MAAVKDLKEILTSMNPVMLDPEYVFCTVLEDLGDVLKYKPWGMNQESEGLSLILEKESADHFKISYEGVFKCITLNVNSSLEAVGLTAKVATELSHKNISANVVAGYHHDHIFVQKIRADEALNILSDLQKHSHV